jgi:DNA repair photolyase
MRAQSRRWISRSQEFSEVVPCSPKPIRAMFYRAQKSNDGMEYDLIRQRSPVQIGHASDPLQPAEKRYGVTLEVLRILRMNEYPTIITTKFPGSLTEPPYLRVLDGLPLVVQCSISTEDLVMLSKLEPNAPSWKRRMAALSTLHDAGVHVILRLWPFIPDLAGNLESLLMTAKDAGVQTVQCNFLKLFNAGRDVRRFRDALGYDLQDSSCMAWEQRGNFKIASLGDQRREILALEDMCHGLGLRVVSCDDLTGSRNWQDCCGVGKLPGFKPSPWAYYMNGHRITEHTDFGEYMRGHKCPWNEEFEKEWDSGRLAKAAPELIFHEEVRTYTRRW